MPSFPFEIEFVDLQGRFVLARQLEAGAFRVTFGAQLGGIAVTSVSQPRATAADGTPRLDIFGFRIADPATASRLRVGQRVELRADDAT